MSTDKEIKTIQFKWLLKEVVAKKKSFFPAQVDEDVDEITIKEAIQIFEKVIK